MILFQANMSLHTTVCTAWESVKIVILILIFILIINRDMRQRPFFCIRASSHQNFFQDTVFAAFSFVAPSFSYIIVTDFLVLNRNTT